MEKKESVIAACCCFDMDAQTQSGSINNFQVCKAQPSSIRLSRVVEQSSSIGITNSVSICASTRISISIGELFTYLRAYFSMHENH